MLAKRQFTHFKEARKLAKQRKIEVKNNILTENTFVLLENESTEGSWVSEKHTSWQRDLDWEENGDSEDDGEITYDYKDVLDVNAFTKLIGAVQDSNNFESHKTLFLLPSSFYITKNEACTTPTQTSLISS